MARVTGAKASVGTAIAHEDGLHGEGILHRGADPQSAATAGVFLILSEKGVAVEDGLRMMKRAGPDHPPTAAS